MADKAGHSSADYSGVVETAQIAVTGERAKQLATILSSGESARRDRAARKKAKTEANEATNTSGAEK